MQHSPKGVLAKPKEGLDWGGNCLMLLKIMYRKIKVGVFSVILSKELFQA